MVDQNNNKQGEGLLSKRKIKKTSFFTAWKHFR